jgi:predicted metal-binding protein
LSNIYRILQTSFYYGPFEYPQGSGNWYQGKHEPLINKELFEAVQEQLKRDRIVRETKEFAFTKLITCGLCGSGVTADEKYKKLKNGNVVKYVYYGCTRSRDLHCKCGYIREEELIKQMIKIIENLNINEISLKKQFQEEVDRYNKFQSMVLRMNGRENEIDNKKEFDIKTYARYVLKEGGIEEKRELLASLKSKLVLNKKVLSLKK